MQNIAERTEELVREAGIRMQHAVDTVVAELGERRREERGQTAAEYMGILFVVALIIAALISAGVPDKIGEAAASLIDKIANGGG
jgi:Flp pilus assembly pilin Flp